MMYIKFMDILYIYIYIYILYIVFALDHWAILCISQSQFREPTKGSGHVFSSNSFSSLR